MKTTNYFNTFIEVSEDCPVNIAEIPPEKGKKKSMANLQFDMLYGNPYQFTSDELIFKIFSIKNNIAEGNMEIEKEKFFSKGQACLRASPLAKRYGWGIHFNEDGKIGVYGVGTQEYKKFSKAGDLKHLRAMRSKRK